MVAKRYATRTKSWSFAALFVCNQQNLSVNNGALDLRPLYRKIHYVKLLWQHAGKTVTNKLTHLSIGVVLQFGKNKELIKVAKFWRRPKFHPSFFERKFSFIFTPVHDFPSPSNPILQEQLNDPGKLVQSAFKWQSCLSTADVHSLMSGTRESKFCLTWTKRMLFVRS